MTSAFLLLISAGAIAAVAFVIISFLQFIFHSAICTGCGMALVKLNGVAPSDFELFAMAALMAVIAMALLRAWQGWKAGLQRVGMA